MALGKGAEEGLRPTKLRALASAVAAAAAVLALCASPALAVFHRVKIREVYPGSALNPDSEYVELQMYEADQNLIEGHVVTTYDAAGEPIATDPFAVGVLRSADQSTFLMATPQAEAQFDVVADGVLAPSGQLEPAGGAVCWEALDCVSWGSFTGSLPSPAGIPAPAIPDGMALQRTIAPGCPTELEETDDHDDSRADFVEAFPSPRPNSMAPIERPCGSTPGSGGRPIVVPVGPRTKLRSGPPKRTADRTPTFRFHSEAGPETFQCRLDGRPFVTCRSPFTAPELGLGMHTFTVRAKAGSGRLEATPRTYSFTIVEPRENRASSGR